MLFQIQFINFDFPMTDKKTRLLRELHSLHYVMIKPSGVHGIGVFAVRDIPKGCREMFAEEDGEWVNLTFEEVNALPEAPGI
jgi:hypothetical protein